jgi:hypothetical protein
MNSSHAYIYELKTLPQLLDIQRVMSDKNPDYIVVSVLVQKCNMMAGIFAEKINPEWILKYLNDECEIGALSELSIQCSRISPTFSRSHSNWLDELRTVKLQWDWDTTKQDHKLNYIVNEFNNLQTMALLIR